MKYLWILWFPLLYLPTFALSGATGFGTLSISDFLIGPYMVLVFLRLQHGQRDQFEKPKKIYIQRLMPIMILFLWWAFFATITISGRYDYNDSYFVNFGLLKIAKWILYVSAVIVSTKALAIASKYERQLFLWAFLVSGLLVGLGLILTGNGNQGGFTDAAAQAQQLFEDNGINVLLSMVIAFLVGMLVKGNGTKSWRRAVSLGLIIIVLGFVSARGRGGWIAALAAMVYIGANINIAQTIRATIIGVLIFSFAYNNNPTFRTEVDKTVEPADTGEYYQDIYGEVNLGVDDGGRLGIAIYMARRIINDPIIGRGIFHRGAKSGTYPTGSHNFFIQMFLETGVPGGFLIIVIFRLMWVHASSLEAKRENLALPVQAALIAGIVSGLTETYFYGGMELFTLLIIYSMVGSLEIPKNLYYD